MIYLRYIVSLFAGAPDGAGLPAFLLELKVGRVAVVFGKFGYYFDYNLFAGWPEGWSRCCLVLVCRSSLCWSGTVFCP